MKAFVAERIEPAMKQVDPETGFTFEIGGWIPGMSLEPGHELTSLIKQLHRIE